MQPKAADAGRLPPAKENNEGVRRDIAFAAHEVRPPLPLGHALLRTEGKRG